MRPGSFFCKADAIAAEASLLGIVAVVAATTEVVVGGLLDVVLVLEAGAAAVCAVDDTGVGVRLGSLTGDLTGVLLPLDTPTISQNIFISLCKCYCLVIAICYEKFKPMLKK